MPGNRNFGRAPPPSPQQPPSGGRAPLTPPQIRLDNLLLRRFSIVIWVPSDQVGMVIGKQGTMITHIRSKANVIDVRVMPPDTYGGFEGSAWAPIQIRGSPSATRAAIAMVTELVDEIDDVVAEIQLDKARHHLIIGTKGVVIRKLSADSDVRIHVPNKKEAEQANKNNEPPMKVVLEGAVENVYRCLSAIMDVCFTPPGAKKDAQITGSGVGAERSGSAGPSGSGTEGAEASTAEAPESTAPVPEERVERGLDVTLSKLKLLDAKALLHNTKSQHHRGGLPVYLEVAKLTSTTITRTRTPAEMATAASRHASESSAHAPAAQTSGTEAAVAAVVEGVVAAAVAAVLGGYDDAGEVLKADAADAEVLDADVTNPLGAEELETGESGDADADADGAGDLGSDEVGDKDGVGAVIGNDGESAGDETDALESADGDEDGQDPEQGEDQSQGEEKDEGRVEGEEGDEQEEGTEGEQGEGDGDEAELIQNDDVDTPDGYVTFTILGPVTKVSLAAASLEKIISGKKALYVLQHLRAGSKKSGRKGGTGGGGGGRGKGGGGARGGRGGRVAVGSSSDTKAQSGPRRRSKAP